MKAAITIVLLACAAGASAQGLLPPLREDKVYGEGRISKGGVAPIIDLRIQDAGIAVPRGMEEQQMGIPPKPEAAATPPAEPAAQPKPAAPPAPQEQPK
jgi:hypothetical protein